MDYSPKVSRSSPGLLTTSERHQDVLVNQDGAVYEKDLGENRISGRGHDRIRSRQLLAGRTVAAARTSGALRSRWTRRGRSALEARSRSIWARATLSLLSIVVVPAAAHPVAPRQREVFPRLEPRDSGMFQG